MARHFITSCKFALEFANTLTAEDRLEWFVIIAFLVSVPTFSALKRVHLLIWFKPMRQFLCQNKGFVFTFEVRLAIVFSSNLTGHKPSIPLFGVSLLSAKSFSPFWVVFPEIVLYAKGPFGINYT